MESLSHSSWFFRSPGYLDFIFHLIYFGIFVFLSFSVGQARASRGNDHALGDIVLLAQEYVSTSFNRPDIEDRQQVQGMNEIIKILFTKNQFLFVNNSMTKEMAYCHRKKHERVLAYVDRDRIIKICPCAQNLAKKDLAQVLIHEAAHLAFDLGANGRDECRATMWEINLVRLGGGVPFQNRYVQTCGLEKLGPFRSVQSYVLRGPAHDVSIPVPVEKPRNSKLGFDY